MPEHNTDLELAAAHLLAYLDADTAGGNDGLIEPILAYRPGLANLVNELRNALNGVKS